MVHLFCPLHLLHEEWHDVVLSYAPQCLQQLLGFPLGLPQAPVTSTGAAPRHVVLGHLFALDAGEVLEAIGHELPLQGVYELALYLRHVVGSPALPSRKEVDRPALLSLPAVLVTAQVNAATV